MITVYNQYNRIRDDKGETFALPSLTDQLADEPLERIVNRFMAAGAPLPTMQDGVEIDDLGELEGVFERLAAADVSQLTRVEMADVLVTARRLQEQLNKAQTLSDAEKRKSKAEASVEKTPSNDSLKEGKIATEPQNG